MEQHWPPTGAAAHDPRPGKRTSSLAFEGCAGPATTCVHFRTEAQAPVGTCVRNIDRLLSATKYSLLLRSWVMAKGAAVSPAVSLMEALVAGEPRTLGDRERIQARCGLLRLVIQSGIEFWLDDLRREGLGRLEMDRCVGVFRGADMHLYSLACQSNSTYALAFERHEKMDPWACHSLRSVQGGLSTGRVHPRAEVVDMATTDVDDTILESTSDGHPVWHCTSMCRDTIVLVRYRAGERFHGEQPARRKSMKREEWARLQASQQDSVRDLSLPSLTRREAGRRPAVSGSAAVNLLEVGLWALGRQSRPTDRAAFMSKLMKLAIDLRLEFRRDDGPRLISIAARVGSGCNLLSSSSYARACAVGGTYCSMWESAFGRPAWKWKGQRTDNARQRSDRVGVGAVLVWTQSAAPDRSAPACRDLAECIELSATHIKLLVRSRKRGSELLCLDRKQWAEQQDLMDKTGKAYRLAA